MKNFISLMKKCCIFLGFFFTSCSFEKNDNILLVGISPDNPPYEYLDDEAKIVGIDVDIIECIGKKLNKTIEIKNIDFNSLIPSLKAGHIDIVISGLSKTEERAKEVDFSIKYLSSNNAIFFLKSNDNQDDKNSLKNQIENHHFKNYTNQNELNNLTIELLKDKTVGVQAGSIGWIQLEQLQHIAAKLNNEENTFEIKVMNNNVALLQELKLGNIDYLWLEEHQSNYILKNGINVDYVVTSMPVDMHIALPKNSKLTEKINQIIQKMIDSGEIAKIIEKHTN